MIVGIVGAGQLGRMLALAAHAMGVRCLLLDAEADSAGAQVAPSLVAPLDDAGKLAELAAAVDVITFDVENVPVEALAPLAGRVVVRPDPAALAAAQDRLAEKRLFGRLDIPTVPHRAVEDLKSLEAAVDELGLPAVLKARRLGYDGRGQRFLRKPDELEPAWRALGEGDLILEAFVPFEREVSLIAARRPSGEIRYYPLAANTHTDGILDYTVAPHESPALQQTAESALERVLVELDYAGVLAVEFFVHEGRLLANEMAPRVHNTGHWTIEGAATSQFENHVRAILDLPLGDTSALGHSAMVNFLGEMPPIAEILAIPGAHYHGYGKAPRPKRKIGHATVLAATPGELESRLERLRAVVGPR
jgi:5-(carboxyamino)imidazole ribonucleotide synthase